MNARTTVGHSPAMVRRMRWLWVVLIGGVVGSGAALADSFAGSLEQTGWQRALSLVLNAGFVWAGAAVLCGWLMVRPRWAAPAGSVVLLCAVGFYYVVGATLGDRTTVGLGALSGAAGLWLAAALVAGPLLGLAGALIHRGGIAGTLAALIVPAGAAAEILGVRRLASQDASVDPWLFWTQTLIVVIAAGSAILVLVRSRRPSRAVRPDKEVQPRQRVP